jgi:hypothetical protein
LSSELLHWHVFGSGLPEPIADQTALKLASM